MKEEVKHMWIDALTSGKYKKGKYALKQNHEDGSASYCCLGVLCDVYLEQGGTGAWVGKSSDFKTQTEIKSGTLPHAVTLWAGLPGRKWIDEESNLIQLNDSIYSTFLPIAKYIEKNL